ncbi:DUF2905 domain-containing protein [Aminithiophilus ramosus]|uniref:DUF2905 domain-containing protein n=2 Tax=Synergistales TaxID=649776 RepID=A0A9Q7AQK9_9BACT|nr:DUF2905 domain-containing protein [Aminithiophilus ramosus]QTX33577.1 DUF2905 domain-containing protein [Aminithiophilus ramosus]QVL37431.1 DUF2905 domain-containing protein [Synergistota bacterium]
MSALGRLVMGLGLALLVCGACLVAASRLSLPLGHLPGDWVFRRGNFRFFFPLTSMILVSLVLSLAAHIIGRWLR